MEAIFLVIQVVDKVITILTWAIIIRALLSFIPHSPRQPIIKILYDITDPLLKPFQRFQLGGAAFAVDFSPIIAIFVLNLIRVVLIRMLGYFL